MSRSETYQVSLCMLTSIEVFYTSAFASGPSCDVKSSPVVVSAHISTFMSHVLQLFRKHVFAFWVDTSVSEEHTTEALKIEAVCSFETLEST
jgi:hypothetical protein